MATPDEAALIEKLRRIEALHAGATTNGERVAAAETRKRILGRLAELAATDPPVEFRFKLPDPWSRQVFNALARRYALEPYRHRGQHRQTVMLMVSKSSSTARCGQSSKRSPRRSGHTSTRSPRA